MWTAAGIWIVSGAIQRSIRVTRSHPQALRESERVTLFPRLHGVSSALLRGLAPTTRLDLVLPMNTGAGRWRPRSRRAAGATSAGHSADRAGSLSATLLRPHGTGQRLYGTGLSPGIRPFHRDSSLFRTAVAALVAAIAHTCAFLVEPIQCEAGVIISPDSCAPAGDTGSGMCCSS
jgi:hypothetical protein